MARTKQFDLPRFFQALGDTTRLRLLNLMGEQQEVCVCYFVEILGAPQPKISRHLAYLRNAGIVSSRREGKWVHYRIVMPGGDNADRERTKVSPMLRFRG
jgi:ArsR family transcriptional regulator, arsenate/arsenite/antimonite-responsive transcriptional repressor